MKQSRSRSRSISKFAALIQEAVACNRQGFQIPEKNKSIFQSAIDLVNMVKLRFQNNECGYRDFLNAVLSENQYGNAAASRLVGHQDLLEAFVRIVSRSEQIPEESETEGETDSEDYHVTKRYRKGLDLFERVKVSITTDNSDEYLKFLKQVHGYNMNRIAMADVVQSLSKYPEIKAEFEELVEECQNIGTGLGHRRLETEKNCCTPSYWYLPPTDHYYERSLVLNYEWVSKSLVDEKYFRNRPVTPREEMLNKCEDDRHELDLLLNRLRTTIAKMEEILREKLINIEEHLSILHFKCIEKLYGEWSRDVIEALIKNPAVVVPVILASLKGKVEECEEHRVAFNIKIWAPIQAGNHLTLKLEQEDSMPANLEIQFRDKCLQS